MIDKKDQDPFPHLPRRPMFTGMGVQPEDAPGFQPLDTRAVGVTDETLKKMNEDAARRMAAPEVGEECSSPSITSSASASSASSSAASGEQSSQPSARSDGSNALPPKRTGRPPKHGETKPWVTEGISRALWYRRQKAGK